MYIYIYKKKQKKCSIYVPPVNARISLNEIMHYVLSISTESIECITSLLCTWLHKLKKKLPALMKKNVLWIFFASLTYIQDCIQQRLMYHMSFMEHWTSMSTSFRLILFFTA